MSRIWWLWFTQLYKLVPTNQHSNVDDLAVLQAFSDVGGDESLPQIKELENILASFSEGPQVNFRQLFSDVQNQIGTDPHSHPIQAVSGLQNALDALNLGIGEVRNLPSVTSPTYPRLKISVGTSSPTNPAVGDLWVDTN
jgi:hypothetical protein